MKLSDKEKLLDQRLLKRLLHYSPSTRIFTWKKRPLSYFVSAKFPHRTCSQWNARNSGKKAGTNTPYVCIRININGVSRKYRAHRLAVLYMTGSFPAGKISLAKSVEICKKIDNTLDRSIPVDVLKDAIRYDYIQEAFYWVRSVSWGVKKGDMAGTVDIHGNTYITFRGKKYPQWKLLEIYTEDG